MLNTNTIRPTVGADSIAHTADSSAIKFTLPLVSFENQAGVMPAKSHRIR